MKLELYEKAEVLVKELKEVTKALDAFQNPATGTIVIKKKSYDDTAIYVDLCTELKDMMITACEAVLEIKQRKLEEL